MMAPIEDWEETVPEYDYTECDKVVSIKDVKMFDMLCFELQVYCLHSAYERYQGRSVCLEFPGDKLLSNDTIQLTRAELSDYFREACRIN